MNKLLSILFLFLLLSCERHETYSEVNENEKVNSAELSLTEDILSSFLQRDYEKLNQFLNSGSDIDQEIVDGKNLIYLAVEAKDYKMISYLVDREASVSQELFSINGEDDQSVIITSILEGDIELVSQSILFDELKNVSKNSDLDLEWISKLIVNSKDLTAISEKEFSKTLISKASNANNYSSYLSVLTESIDINSTDWPKWSISPFVSGRYRKASCSFYETESCVTFEQFLDSCSEKYAKKLVKAASKIEPYLLAYNSFNGCSLK